MADAAEQLGDRELISRAIKASGKSVRRFAREDLVREPRTVWRWLAGENPIPRAVHEMLSAYVAANPLPPDADASPLAPDDDAE